MERDRRWDVPGLPAEDPGSPREVRVLPIGEEVLVEHLSLDRHIIQHGPAVQGRGSRDAEHLVCVIKSTAVKLTLTPVQMALGGEEADAGRIDSGRIISLQQLACCRSDTVVSLECGHQVGDIVRAGKHVRVEGQVVGAGRAAYQQIVGGGEPGVSVEEGPLPRLRQPFEDLSRAIRGCVVDNPKLNSGIGLLADGSDGTLDKRGRVPADDAYGDCGRQDGDILPRRCRDFISWITDLYYKIVIRGNETRHL